MKLASAAAPSLLAALLACAAVGALDPLVLKDVPKGVKLEHCEGPCSDDDYCAENMKCIQRTDCARNIKCDQHEESEKEFVDTLRKVGCAGKVHFKANYCIDPDKKVKDEWWTTTAEPTTASPTLSPTTKAEKRPLRVPDVTSILTILTNAVKVMAGYKPDPVELTEMPTAAPSNRAAPSDTTAPSPSPTLHPTDAPTVSPTLSPTNNPTLNPTNAPTVSPTLSPTNNPTESPTASPTVDPNPPKPIPKDPKDTYFDYSDDSKYGPSKWGDLKGEKMDEADYWEEFEEYLYPSLTENMCDNNDKSARQSPIDVSFKEATSQCFEYHQIRSKAGEWGVTHPKVEKQILPNKLRLVYDREFDGDFEGAEVNDKVEGASADMPKAWGYQLPVLNVDVKIPSEHWMEGKQYAAEYQIFLIQNKEKKKRGVPAISVFFDIHPEDEDHTRIGQMIDEFQKVYDADLAECENFRRKQRRLGAWAKNTLDPDATAAEEAQSTILDEPEEVEVEFQKNLGNLRRKVQESEKVCSRLAEYRCWNPFHETIIRSLWFYGYEGSLTEPPCSEFVEWRIILEPALISTRQLFQMKKILFGHVNGKCERTSVHSDENGVARPLQPLNGRALYQCMCRDFIGDKDRRTYGENRCKWTERDQFGFDKEKYTYEWLQATHPYTSIEEYWEDNDNKPHWAS